MSRRTSHDLPFPREGGKENDQETRYLDTQHDAGRYRK